MLRIRRFAATERRLTRPQAERVDVRPDVRVAELAAASWGVLSVEDLHGAGLSDDGIRVRVCNGRLHPVHRGVYAVGHSNLPLEGLLLAAVKACGGTAVLSHYAAGAVWGLVEWDGRDPEVTVTSSGTRIHPGIRVHRTGVLEPVDVGCRSGIPITTPSRTLVDLASVLGYRALRRAVREAQATRLARIGRIHEALTRLGPRRGTRNLRRIISSGPAPTRSELEDVVLDLILRAGFAHPDVNLPLVLDGRRVVPDFRWPAQRLIVEADGAAWHDHPLAREDDAERQALLEAHGNRVLRVTWGQAVRDPTGVRARLEAAGAPVERRVVRRQTE